MENKSAVERYVRAVLMINGIGDIVLGALMILLPGQVARMLNFSLNEEIVYLTGGWGTASMSFGAMRFFAGMSARPEVRWFVAAFLWRGRSNRPI
jgi:formate hydrogenlyase subunit 3/multisubunit Na+/H+ antiporter MnhD subunit